jgi:cytochrome c oxidase assembly protein subunit 15
MVFIQVAVGGITRLTHSGLSIVDWSLIMGTLPPLSEAAWQKAFEMYQLSPEFIHVNYGFSLSDFKGIFWWEYFHRLFGRLIGVVFVIPFVWFLYKKAFTRRQIYMLLLVFLLGAFQAFLGWYMVKSGLIKEPRVSHFRLAAHLFTAFVTCLLIWRISLPLWVNKAHISDAPALRKWALVLLSISGIQVIYGAFVAGLRAGGSHNTYPMMDGAWMPDAVWALQPAWTNFFEGVSGVQFVHRIWAHLLLAAVFYLWLNRRKFARGNAQIRAVNLLSAVVLGQFCLGVFTLLLRVPLSLGIAHQAGALLMMGGAVYLWFISSGNSQSDVLDPA